MTYLEKVLELNPDLHADTLILSKCPLKYLRNTNGWCSKHGYGDISEICASCWNQEYEGEEVI